MGAPPLSTQARRGNSTHEFFSMKSFQAWQDSEEWKSGGWRLKYYKGLGTSTSEEGKAYFSNLPLHRKNFVWAGESDNAAIRMAFGKDQVRYQCRCMSTPGGVWSNASAVVRV